MDYLLSLVGKDQDTIVEAIKELAQNGEKVKIQDKEIDDLKCELEEGKEEIHYLKNKLDQKYDSIEDLEHDLDQLDEKFKVAKKELNEKDYQLQYQKNVMENKDRMISDINDMRKESEEKCSELEKKISVQSKVIQELKNELKQKSEYLDVEEEVKNLIEEINHLKLVNEEKEVEIENISREKVNLEAQVESEKKTESMCLQDELGLGCSRKFICKECENTFSSVHLLRSHVERVHMSTMKHRLNQLEILILEQKLDFTQTISKLKEAEQTCSCSGWCAINHQKHSWKKSSSKELYSKFEKLAKKSFPDEMKTCNICEKQFTNVSHLETHMHMLENVNFISEEINSFVHECNSCKEKFASPDDFIFHVENSHKVAAVMFLG